MSIKSLILFAIVTGVAFCQESDAQQEEGAEITQNQTEATSKKGNPGTVILKIESQQTKFKVGDSITLNVKLSNPTKVEKNYEVCDRGLRDKWFRFVIQKNKSNSPIGSKANINNLGTSKLTLKSGESIKTSIKTTLGNRVTGKTLDDSWTHLKAGKYKVGVIVGDDFGPYETTGIVSNFIDIEISEK